jgi:hypothetical protein
MQAFSPGPPSPTAPNGPGSPIQRSFFGGTFFTSPPEEVGDISAENRRRKSWWGGERDSSLSRKASGVDRKSEKEKQRSGKEKSREEPTNEEKEKSKGQSNGEKVKVERVKVETRRGVVKEGVKQNGPGYPGSGKVAKDVIEVEVAGEVEAAGRGSLPIGEDKVGEAGKKLEAGTVERTDTEDDTPRSLGQTQSLYSLISNKSTGGSPGSTKPSRKRWSRMVVRRSTPEQIRIPSQKLTEDVAGPRFEKGKEPEGERCAGDYPPIYDDGFVSCILSSYLYSS